MKGGNPVGASLDSKPGRISSRWSMVARLSLPQHTSRSDSGLAVASGTTVGSMPLPAWSTGLGQLGSGHTPTDGALLGPPSTSSRPYENGNDQSAAPGKSIRLGFSEEVAPQDGSTGLQGETGVGPIAGPPTIVAPCETDAAVGPG
ncbi:hypothetical protein PG994_015208 [Apiospora phragmitis]|uniref:Uncharacterized protein n=1 Tax=Apiospora phragmitis TaxID=2905665 RepID=A0ABR1SS77_9PEZI